MKKILETKRLYLREWTVEDAPAMFAIHSDAETMRFVTPPGSLEIERESMQRHIENYYRRFGYGLWATILKEDESYIGRCTLINQTIEGRDDVEMGYLIKRELWNRGLTTEAAMAIRDHAFNELNISRLISIIHPLNIASQRVAEKVGMRLERMAPFKSWGQVMIYAVEK